MTELLSPRANLADALQAFGLQLLSLEQQADPGPGAQTLALHAQELAQQSLLVGAKGIPELLRLLAAGLRDRGTQTVHVPESDIASLLVWSQQAASLQLGLLPVSEVPSLLDLFAGIDWIPPMIPRMRDVLAGRLSEEAAKLFVASEPVLAETTIAEPTLVEPAMVESVIDEPAMVESVIDEPAMVKSVIDESAIVESVIDEPAMVESVIDEPAMVESVIDEPAMVESVIDEPAMVESATVASMSVESTALETTLLADDGEQVWLDLPPEVNWISQDEMALTVTALSEQLLPMLDALSQNQQAELQAGLVDEFHYHFGLVLNALELLNLGAVQRSGDAVQAELAVIRDLSPKAARPAFERISNWLVCLLGWFHTEADPAMAEAFVDSLADPNWLLPSEADARAELLTEMRRVQVGRDPKLQQSFKTEAEPDDVKLDMAADVVASVREGMLRELPRNCEQLRLALNRTCDDGKLSDIDDARRYAHTLKGDANTVGVRGIANLTHALEDILVVLARQPAVPAPDVKNLLISAADCVEAMADHVLGRGPAPDESLAIYQQVLLLSNQVQAGERSLTDTDAELALSASATVTADGQLAMAAATAGTEVEPLEASVRTLQIPVPVLDELLRLSSETIVLARQVEEHLRQINQAQTDLDQQNRQSLELVSQLDDLVALRGAALQSTRLQREREVDALEMDQYNELHVVSRRLIETASDAGAHLLSLDRAMVQVRELSVQQDRVHLALQQSVLNTRSVPFESQVSRFQRVVRQTARQLGKEAVLHVQGEQTPIDADILDQIAEPLVHALRNAVDHGLESPEQRAALGKPAQGELRLRVRRQAGDILISLTDDGAGFDRDAIRRVAEERGLISADTVLSAEQQLQLVFLPGFSTRTQATQISGRGMGMDVLARRVRALRGSLQLRSEAGQGATLDIVLPASLNAAHVALARTRTGVVAAVTGSIQRFLPLRPEDCEIGDDGRLLISVDGNLLPAVTLDALCGTGTGREVLEQVATGMLVQDENGAPTVIVTRQIDELREVIVKGLGAYVSQINGLRGTTILGNGGLAPVLDLALLLSQRGRESLAAWSAPDAARATSVLVVDDSLSVRRALSTLMQDIGFEAVTARDGLEALDSFGRGLKPACILLDLEMPRMNGLELTRYVRNTEWLRHVPIIMITSRTSDRHRQLAEEAGVTELLAKPFQDDALAQLVERLTQTHASAQRS